MFSHSGKILYCCFIIYEHSDLCISLDAVQDFLCLYDRNRALFSSCIYCIFLFHDLNLLYLHDLSQFSHWFHCTRPYLFLQTMQESKIYPKRFFVAHKIFCIFIKNLSKRIELLRRIEYHKYNFTKTRILVKGDITCSF